MPNIKTKFKKSHLTNGTLVREVVEEPLVQEVSGGIQTARSRTLHKSSSGNMFPEIPEARQTFNIKRSPVMDIMSTIESPSHWRFWENKMKVRTNNYHLNFDKVGVK